MGKNFKNPQKKGPASQPVLLYTYKNIMLYIYSEQDLCLSRAGSPTMAPAAFTLAIALTLRTEVVAQHGTEDEVLFGRETAEWLVNDHPHGIEALAASEIEIQTALWQVPVDEP